jgi:hypothetical protein
MEISLRFKTSDENPVNCLALEEVLEDIVENFSCTKLFQDRQEGHLPSH